MPVSPDREAEFAAFVGTYRERALSTAWRLCGGDGALAEDVAQEAFIAAHKALPRFRGDSRMSTWFYRILVRTAHKQRRKRAVREKAAALFGLEAPRSARTVEGDAPLRRRIAAALDTLSPGQRDAFVLVHMEGLTVVEAAE
ncbi:MAG: RNA polymerase sigma factor, partial [Myxococcales bacterium]|nr:RNA polymerase sigma factor [Myxococcales bacterium]